MILLSFRRLRLGNVKFWAVVAVGLALPLALSFGDRNVKADDQRPPLSCTSWGFNRAKAGPFNLCGSDSYSPEYMYWNYYPSTSGYNNPTVGPYYSSVAQGVLRWYSAQSNWQFSYQSGDWSGGTDLFIWSSELDDTFGVGSGVEGYVQHWSCSSSSSCSQRWYSPGGSFNLVYFILDNDLTGGSSHAHDVTTHEFGHAFGLIDIGREPGNCGNPHNSLMAAGCSGSPVANDASAVDFIYPDP